MPRLGAILCTIAEHAVPVDSTSGAPLCGRLGSGRPGATIREREGVQVAVGSSRMASAVEIDPAKAGGTGRARNKSALPSQIAFDQTCAQGARMEKISYGARLAGAVQNGLAWHWARNVVLRTSGWRARCGDHHRGVPFLALFGVVW